MLRVAAIMLVLLVPSAMAADVYLPGTVSGSSVPVVVDGLQGTDTVRVDVGGKTVTLAGSSTIRADTLTSLPRGLHPWFVNITSVASQGPQTTTSHRGYVHVVALDGAENQPIDVTIPGLVPGSAVPVVVAGLRTTDVVQVWMGQLSRNLTDSTEMRATTFAAIEAGLQPWRVNVTNVDGTKSFAGYVHVGATAAPTSSNQLSSTLDEMKASIAAVSASAARTDASISGPNGSLAALSAKVASLQQNVSLQQLEQRSQLDGLRAELKGTNASVDGLSQDQSRVVKQSATARSAGVASTTAAVLVLVLLCVGVAFLWWSERQRHKESLALLLAAASKMGLTGDSEELKQAVAIVDGSSER